MNFEALMTADDFDFGYFVEYILHTQEAAIFQYVHRLNMFHKNSGLTVWIKLDKIIFDTQEVFSVTKKLKRRLCYIIKCWIFLKTS